MLETTRTAAENVEQWRLHVRQLEEELGKATGQLEVARAEGDQIVATARLAGNHPEVREGVTAARMARTEAVVEVDELTTALVHARAQLVDAEREAGDAELEEKRREFSRLVRRRLKVARDIDRKLHQLSVSLGEWFKGALDMEAFRQLTGLTSHQTYGKFRVFGRLCWLLGEHFRSDLPTAHHDCRRPLVQMETELLESYLRPDDAYASTHSERTSDKEGGKP